MPRYSIYTTNLLWLVYTNSFIATLNARKNVAQTLDENGNMLVTFQTVSGADKRASQQGNISIRIDTTQEAHTDGSEKGRVIVISRPSTSLIFSHRQCQWIELILKELTEVTMR